MSTRRILCQNGKLSLTLWQYTFCNVSLIVGGDFNCVLSVQKDKFGGDDTFGDKGVVQLHSFTNSNSLIDIYRYKFPNTPLYTWVNGRRTIGCRLDRFYVPLPWKNIVSNVTAKTFVYSDHLLIRMTCTVGIQGLAVQVNGSLTRHS